MIVRNTNEGLEIIYQSAHGMLAGAIASNLNHKYRPKFWAETFIAITEHDDHQLDFDEKDYLSKVGVPVNFMDNEVPKAKAVERAKRVYFKARAKSQWTALLVYLHIDFLYGTMEFKPMKDFLKDVDDVLKETCSIYAVSKKDALAAYQLVRFSDRLSLILCQSQVPDLGRSLEINTTMEDKRFSISALESGDLTVVPWCFEKDSFVLHVEQRLLKEVTFTSNKSLGEALNALPPRLKKWQFSKSN